jgi:hypothetical protein
MAFSINEKDLNAKRQNISSCDASKRHVATTKTRLNFPSIHCPDTCHDEDGGSKK